MSGGAAFASFQPRPTGTEDLQYAVNGADEPYTAGRGETAGAYAYFSRNVVREAPPMRAVAAPVALDMSCSVCHGDDCMYREANVATAHPFCLHCSREALRPSR